MPQDMKDLTCNTMVKNAMYLPPLTDCMVNPRIPGKILVKWLQFIADHRFSDFIEVSLNKLLNKF